MDKLLAEINNLKHVEWGSKSLTRYAMTISVFVNDMEGNGRTVLEASEVPFFVSQLLSKLDPRDNTIWKRDAKNGTRRKCVKPYYLVTSRGNPSLQKHTKQLQHQRK